MRESTHPGRKPYRKCEDREIPELMEEYLESLRPKFRTLSNLPASISGYRLGHPVLEIRVALTNDKSTFIVCAQPYWMKGGFSGMIGEISIEVVETEI